MSTYYDERLGRYEIAIGEELDFTIDYNDAEERYLGDDTISTSSWVASTGLSINSTSNTSTLATAWVEIDGGTVGETLYLTNTIETTGGRTVPRRLELVVVEAKPQ